MRVPLILRPEAQVDLFRARDWYENQQPGLGRAFVDAVDETLEQISATPEGYVVILKGVRRRKLRRFPYLVYYRLLNDRVEIIGVLHGSRDPGVWQRRA